MMRTAGLAAWSFRMASRAWASAEAVTVQVLMTMMSAAAGVGAGAQPRSSNWRSRAAPSAWVARQPNCWMKKLGIGNHGIKPKKQFTRSSRSTPSPQRRKDWILYLVRTHARTQPAAAGCFTRIAGLVECEKTDSNQDQYWGRTYLYSPEAAPLQSFDNHGPSTIQPFRAGQSHGLDRYSRLQ